MTRKPGPTGDDVLRGLQSHAAELRGESYPGDVVADVRSRLGVHTPRHAAPATGLLAAAAAALLIAAWLLCTPVLPRRPDVTGLPPLPPMPAAVPSLSDPAPSMGRAVSLGVRAWARLRPPTALAPSPPTTKEE